MKWSFMGRPQERGPRRRPRGALFCILEDGFFLLDRHLQRMRDSAEYFGFAFPAGDIHKALGRRRRELRFPWRVRFLLSREGGVHVEHSPLQPSCPPLRIALAAGPIDQDDVFLYHKTTNRTV